MKKHLILAGILALTALAHSANAESPWESGSYKNYGQDNNSGSAPSTALGLQGFSLSPTDNNAQPSAPSAAIPSQAGPAAAQPAMQAGPAPAPSSVNMNLQPAFPSSDPALKQHMGQITDSSFVTLALQGIDGLVSSSKLAQKNAGSADMQQFAGQILSIYDPMTGELNALAKKNNLTPITMPKSQNDLDNLAKLTGSDFDREYMRLQQQDFYLLSTAFSDEVANGLNPTLKAYASNHLSMLDQQKDMVQKSFASAIGSNAMPGTR